jgi:hypothetical protein
MVADAALFRWLAGFLLVCTAGCSDSNEMARLQPVPGTEAVRSVSLPISAGLTWPSAQLLPSFPAPAAVQDLIILHGQAEQWEAEGPSLSHKTGRLETDGWLCQVGVDTANEHMIYGPYDTTVPAGANTAQFRMKTDNNTVDDLPLVTLEVYDSTAGQSLASQVVTRKQFTVAGDYTNFSLPFVLGADNHALELRVLWSGAAYTKVDWVGVSRSQADDEMVLFASLKGIVNAKRPRIFSYEGDAFAEGKYAWLQSLGLGWNEVSNNWDLIGKYQSELQGIIVYDNAQPDTINLATTLAGAKAALVVAPSLAARLSAAPYNLPTLLDFRGKFASKLAVYQTLFDSYWPSLSHRLAFGLDPLAVRAAVREYATAVGAASLWLDPEKPDEAALLDEFLGGMGAGATWMGWWPSEGPGVTEASKYGVATVASDYASNLTLHSGMPRTINVTPMPNKPALQAKIYVAFILSDGDNLQYVEHLLRKLWDNPDRGKVAMGWTLSPAMVDAMPGALNYFWTSATANDCLLSGPSGYGYTYPNLWTNAAQLDQFVTKTEEYNERAGFRVTTVWNTIVGGINANVGSSYAKNAPSLLGVTAQNTGGGLTVYDNSLPGMALSCNYCTGEQAMKDFIASSSQGWNGTEPRFLIIQAQPWQDVKPTSFLNVANSLSTDYLVVRPDHIFQLIREARGLPLNPLNKYSIIASASKSGSISPSGTLLLDQNQNQIFTFTPDPGYFVKAVSVDGASAASASSYTFTNVTANHTISVAFTDSATMGIGGGTSDAGANAAGGDAGGAGGATVPSAGGTSATGAGTSGAHDLVPDNTAPAGNDAAGCSCRASPRPVSTPSTWSVLGLLVLLRRRRAVNASKCAPRRY